MRIDQIGNDLRRYIERDNPALARELEQQDHAHMYYLPMNRAVADAFERAAAVHPSKYGANGIYPLSELADALVYNYDKSSKLFKGGAMIQDRIPPFDQFLNLLKCVWLLEKVIQSPELASQAPTSHWPSYIKELRDVSVLTIPTL